MGRILLDRSCAGPGVWSGRGCPGDRGCAGTTRSPSSLAIVLTSPSQPSVNITIHSINIPHPPPPSAPGVARLWYRRSTSPPASCVTPRGAGGRGAGGGGWPPPTSSSTCLWPTPPSAASPGPHRRTPPTASRSHHTISWATCPPGHLATCAPDHLTTSPIPVLRIRPPHQRPVLWLSSTPQLARKDSSRLQHNHIMEEPGCRPEAHAT